MAACMMADLTGTKRISGLEAASLIASASFRSFFARLANGFTYCGGMSLTTGSIRAATGGVQRQAPASGLQGSTVIRQRVMDAIGCPKSAASV